MIGANGRGVSCSIGAGEIVGLAGLVGSGRTRLLRTLAGEQPLRAGTIRIDGEPVRLRSPRDAIAHGVAMLPEDRLRQGLVDVLDLSANVAFGTEAISGAKLVARRAEARTSEHWIRELGIAGGRPGAPVLSLSGGNQQKVLFARAFQQKPRVLLLDEPTRGVDLGARADLHRLLFRFADEGGTVVVATSDLEELVEIVDAAIVLQEGRCVAHVRADLNRHQLLELCYGHH